MREQIGALVNRLWRPAVAALGISPRLTGALSLTVVTYGALLIVNAGSGIVLARGLGPEGRGDITVATLWPGLIVGIGALGIPGSVAYYAAQDKTRPSRVLATALAMAVPLTLVLVLIGWFALPLILHGKPPQVLSHARFYLWYLPLFPLALYAQSYLQGKLAMGWFNASALCYSVVWTLVLVTLWASHQLTVQAALTASLGAWAVTAGLSLAGAFWKQDAGWRPDPALVRPLLWFGLRKQIGNIASVVVQQRLDLLLLSLFVSTRELGTYAVAGSAAVVAAFLPTAASNVLYPVFARQTSTTLPLAMSRFLLAGGLFTLVTGPILLFLIPFAVPYVYGPAFLSSRPLAALLAVGYLIRGWNSMLTAALSGSGRPFTASIGQAVEVVALAPLLAILIPPLGLTGAGTAVPFAAAAAFIYLLIFSLYTAKLTPNRLAVLWMRQIRAWRDHSPVDPAMRTGHTDP